MDANFLKAYKLTVSNEGSLSNDPNDRGGLTWKGIARNMNPQWQGWKLIDAHLNAKHTVAVILKDTVLEALVQQFYYNEFWLKLRLNELKDVDNACKFFDTAVNVGTHAATGFQQLSVNLPKTGIVDTNLIDTLNSVV